MGLDGRECGVMAGERDANCECRWGGGGAVPWAGERSLSRGLFMNGGEREEPLFVFKEGGVQLRSRGWQH